MSNEKVSRYVIFGAGAIGIPVGGLLQQAGSRVMCVARPAYREALERGVTIRQDGEEMIVKIAGDPWIRTSEMKERFRL